MGSKADTLARDLGDSLADSIGVRDTACIRDASISGEQGAGGSPPDPLDGLTRHKGAGLLLTSHIYTEADQVRVETDPEADAQLVESVRSVGLLQPVRVRWAGDSGKYCVVTGHRRLAAAVACGLDRVPVVVVEGTPTAAGIIEEQLIENIQRSALSPLDQSRAFQKYMTLTGCTGKDLANLLHISPASVSRALALLDLPSEVQEHIASGEISPRAGAAIARIKHPQAQQDVAQRAVATKAPTVEVEQQVRRRRGASAPKQQPVTQFKISRGVARLSTAGSTGPGWSRRWSRPCAGPSAAGC